MVGHSQRTVVAVTSPIRMAPACRAAIHAAILLIGGDKTGNKRFYERMIPIADDLFDAYLEELKTEGLI